MLKWHAAIAATLAIVFATLSLGQAYAGASASAPSKNTRTSQMAAHQQKSHQIARNDFGITEYSSSSARNRSH